MSQSAQYSAATLLGAMFLLAGERECGEGQGMDQDAVRIRCAVIVDIRKLLEYCLNSQHLRGRNKARVFASVGIRDTDADELREALSAAARDAEASYGFRNPYGQR